MPEKVDLRIDGTKLSGGARFGDQGSRARDHRRCLRRHDARTAKAADQGGRRPGAVGALHPARRVAGRDSHDRGAHPGGSTRRLRREPAGNQFQDRRRARGDAAPRTSSRVSPSRPRLSRPCTSRNIRSTTRGRSRTTRSSRTIIPRSRTGWSPSCGSSTSFRSSRSISSSKAEGSCCGSSVSLEELIARQRDNLNRTFALEREPAIDDAAAKRLARYEGELHAATAEFAQGIAAIAGPDPGTRRRRRRDAIGLDRARGQRHRRGPAARGGRA